MKKIFLFIILSTLALPQNGKKFIYYFGGDADEIYNMDLDGSTEYVYKNSPTGMSINDASNVQNDGFETHTGTKDDGTGDTFTGWSLLSPENGYSDATATVNSGTGAVKLVNTGGASFYLYQTINVTASQYYTYSFYTRGDGTYAGRYRIWDNSNGAYIKKNTSTGVTGLTYTYHQYSFQAPTNCTQVVIYVGGNTTIGSSVYFDDVKFYRNKPITMLSWVKSGSLKYMSILNTRSGTGQGLSFGAYNDGVLSLYGQGSATNTGFLKATTNIADNLPHLVGYTIKALRDSVIFWLDGVRDKTVALPNIGSVNNEVVLQIGNSVALGLWEGYIGETAIFSDELTISEVNSLYERGVACVNFNISDSLISHYKFNGNSDAQFLQDEVGNNNLTGANVTRADDQIRGCHTFSSYIWEELSDSIMTKTKDGVEAIYFANKHWLFGGWKDGGSPPTDNEIWSSNNASGWDSVGVAGWSRSHTFYIYTVGDTIFKVGGDVYVRDSTTWKSTDGISWVQISSNNKLSNRVLVGFVQSPNKDTLFAYNGQTVLYPSTSVVNDSIYISTNNGRTFTAVAKTVWQGGSMYNCFIYYHNKYWKIGGGIYGETESDSIFNSNDGINWSYVSTITAFRTPQYGQLKIFDDKIFSFNGYNYVSGGNLAQTFYTSNGIDWYAVITPWEKRHACSGWTQGGYLYLFGGTGNGEQYRDVWRLRAL
jgi:hypothetical protein